VMLAGWYLIGRAVYVRLAKPPAGGAKLVEHGFRTHVYSIARPTLVAAAGTLLGTCFVSTFIVGFGFGFNPPMPVIQIVWTVVLLLTLAVTAIVAVRAGPGKELLVIDQVGQTITLPARRRRQEPVCIPFASIERVEVDRRTTRGSKGARNRSYVPTIVYADGEGSEQRAILGRKHDPAEAEGLATWIDAQLHGARR